MREDCAELATERGWGKGLLSEFAAIQDLAIPFGELTMVHGLFLLLAAECDAVR
jgi:23S rRNA pseudoU1915 N3-methylase RlmH